MHTPVHRFLTFVDHALLDEAAERPDDVGLIAGPHRQVGVVPFAEHAKAFEVDAHDVDVFRRIRLTFAAKVGDGHLPLLGAELAVDFELDRQTVTIPSRHVGCIKAGHASRLDDKVLQDLVEGRANVDFAIGVRRPIVKHKFFSA
jgi:hypothetical protein